ncbi:MAG: DUF3500 domain-containing protein, partial [Verrucomicrobiota bacterium]
MRQSIPFLIVLSCLSLIAGDASSQGAGKGKGKGKSKGGGRIAEAEERAIADPFVGVTADGAVEPGLFEIRATGVSTAPIRAAAEQFLKVLSPEQRAKTTFPIDDIEWRRWANQHSLVRQGVSFEEMSESQREAAFGLLAASLSADGLKLTEDIMKLNETLAELTGKHSEYGRWLYHLTVMGEPSTEQPWGWQFDGHHCVINYFVLGDQVVMSPAFFGSEPVRAESGAYAGTVILQDEETLGLRLARSLTNEQKGKAVIAASKSGTDARGEAFQDNLVLPYEGIPVSELSQDQIKSFRALLAVWTGKMRGGHDGVKFEEVMNQLDRTFFAWVGEMDDEAVFYYRIHSPVILIEFDHQRPIGLERTGIPTKDHIHAVIRTPNGNDYGKDLLRQHLEQHH